MQETPEEPNDSARHAEPEGTADKAKELASDLVEKAKPIMDKAGEVAGDLAEKAKPALDKAGEVAARALDKAKDWFKKDDGANGGDAAAE